MRLDANQSAEFSCTDAQVDMNLLCRVAYDHHPKICQYYLTSPYGTAVLRTFSEDELLFLMHNNAKKMLGLPMTRVAKRGRRAHDYKRKRKMALVYPHVYAWVKKTLDDQISKELNRYFDNMAEKGEIGNYE